MSRSTLSCALCAMLFALCPSALAQQGGRVPRIGYLGAGSAQAETSRLALFHQGLREMGYFEKKNVLIEYRFAAGRLDVFPQLAAELVRLDVDVIVTAGNEAVQAAKDATRTIPIVMAFSGDPVEAGFVLSLARPGGNVTGISRLNNDLSAKRLELLKETVPGLARVAILFHPEGPFPLLALKEARAAAEG